MVRTSPPPPEWGDGWLGPTGPVGLFGSGQRQGTFFYDPFCWVIFFLRTPFFWEVSQNPPPGGVPLGASRPPPPPRRGMGDWVRADPSAFLGLAKGRENTFWTPFGGIFFCGTLFFCDIPGPPSPPPPSRVLKRSLVRIVVHPTGVEVAD